MGCFVQPESYEHIGKIKKTKGLDGGVIVALLYPDVALGLERVYFLRDYTYVPYVVVSWEMKGRYAHVQLKDIDDRTAAQAWRGYDVFADAAMVKEALAGSPFRLVGYVVHDVVHGALGYVAEVEEGEQWLLHVEGEKKRLFIPLCDAFVQEVDEVGGRIRTVLSLDYIKSAEETY